MLDAVQQADQLQSDRTHQVELVIQQCLSVSAHIQLGGEAVVRVEPPSRYVQPNLAHCIQQYRLSQQQQPAWGHMLDTLFVNKVCGKIH